jgi:hypothetical protein
VHTPTEPKIIEINGRYYEVVNEANTPTNNYMLVEQDRLKDELEHQERVQWEGRASDKMKFR